MMTTFKRLSRDEAGATGIEYAMLASMLAIAVLAAVQVISQEAVTSFENTANAFSAGNP